MGLWWSKQAAQQGNCWLLLLAFLVLGVSSDSPAWEGESSQSFNHGSSAQTFETLTRAGLPSDGFRYRDDDGESAANDDSFENASWCCVDDLCQLERHNPYAELVRQFYLRTMAFPYKEKASACYTYLSALLADLCSRRR